MKVKARKPRARNSKRFAVKGFSLSTAKTFLGHLLDKAKRGEEVVICRGAERFVLREIPPIEPIPIRPPGYFQYDEEDIALDRKGVSVRPRREEFE
jgi:hypothetical protein